MAHARPHHVDANTVRAWLGGPDAVHIRGSHNVPLHMVGDHTEQLAARLDRPVVLVCQSGTRAARAHQHLAGLAAGLRAPKARLLAGGIGAGLTFSALTDTCTMGRILSALPYNRGPRDRTPIEVLAQLPTGQVAA